MILPTNFINVVLEKKDNYIKRRSNILSLDDCNNWVTEFGKVNNLKWNTRSSRPIGKKIICSLVYILEYKLMYVSCVGTFMILVVVLMV